ncbi:secretion system protein E [Halobacteriales archaeon QS_1_68_20]|nr:MAG: secretion system protein E [Halobacteriales archaeon QS_1_68_20]
MATDDADASGPGEPGDADGSAAPPAGADAPDASEGEPARLGEYTWADFMKDHGHGAGVEALYDQQGGGGLLGRGDSGSAPSGDDWDRVSFDPTQYLGFHPDDLGESIREDDDAAFVSRTFLAYVDPATTPVAKDEYTWEHYKWEYYYEEDGSPPRDDEGEKEPFQPGYRLGFDPDDTEGVLSNAENIASELSDVVEDRTVTTIDRFDEEDLKAISDVTVEDVENFDEDDFFSDEYGNTTVTNRYDLEKTVPQEKKTHFLEEDRYWVNKPYAFVIIFHSVKENEKKYYVVEPHRTEIEADLKEFLTGKLRNAIKYSDDDVVVEGSESDRAAVIERETRQLLRRYGLFTAPSSGDDAGGGGFLESLTAMFEEDDEDEPDTGPRTEQLDGIEARPEPVILEENPETVNEYQVEKLLYYLKRDFIGYERIDPIKQDTVNVEDISCDGYNSPVFVYHGDYEQIITNVYHGKQELDDFVVKMAQRSGKGISKRNPQVDATLPDGSRAQLTLGQEVSDHGTNYTIRQFKDVPFTPIDLINWNTFSLDEMAFLWLCIENHKSLIFAGGTASGKTTSLNAISLFIPSSAKIVSIEDTREVELPQRNWIASVTRPSFGEEDTGDVDEFDLLEAALRQRPDYIVMGEIRGEEGRTLFQVMSTGHTTYTTFHADSVGEVLKRFTTDPINVSKTMFTALDLVSIQTQTRVQGHKVRRNKNLTEINHYDAENDEINVQDVYQWQAETDEFLKMGDSNTLEEIMFDRGWSHERLQDELFWREVVLAYLIQNGLNTYTEVAATLQAFINEPKTILTLIANDQLAHSLEDLREMESVIIDVDPQKEEMAPRPDPPQEIENLCMDILDRAEDSLFEEYRGKETSGLVSSLDDVEADEAPPGELKPPEEDEEIEFSGELSEDAFEGKKLAVDDEVEDPPMLEGDDAQEAMAEATPDADDAATADSSPGETATADGPDLEPGTDDADAPEEATAEAGLAGDAESEDPEEDGPEWLFGGEDEPVFVGDEDEGDDTEEADPEVELSFDDVEDDGSADEGETGGLAFGPETESDGSASDDGATAGGDAGGDSGFDTGGGSGFDGDDGSGFESAGGSGFGPADGPPGDGSGDGSDGSGSPASDDGGLAFGDDEDGADGGADDGFAFDAEEDDETDEEEAGDLAFGGEAIEDGGSVTPPDDAESDDGFGGFEGVNAEDDEEEGT